MLDYNNKLTPPADLIDALRNIPNKASIVASLLYIPGPSSE